MSHDWPVAQASEADAAGIASLFVSSWVSPFSRLQLGDIDPTESAADMATRIARALEKQDGTYSIVRNPDTKEVVAVAQWVLPTDETAKDPETPEEQEERKALETELYVKSMPESRNKDLILEFINGLRRLRVRLLQGERFYYLNNIATHTNYRGQGLASRLVEDMLRQADAENTLVYLETASDNPAERLYKRLGFEEQGKFVIKDMSKFASKEEIERCGGITEHMHVAYIRRPKRILV